MGGGHPGQNRFPSPSQPQPSTPEHPALPPSSTSSEDWQRLLPEASANHSHPLHSPHNSPMPPASPLAQLLPSASGGSGGGGSRSLPITTTCSWCSLTRSTPCSPASRRLITSVPAWLVRTVIWKRDQHHREAPLPVPWATHRSPSERHWRSRPDGGGGRRIPAPDTARGNTGTLGIAVLPTPHVAQEQ